MQVIVVEPGEKPVVQDIQSSLGAMQEIVGGPIQAVYPFAEAVALICNEEGKLLNLPLNRALRDKNGRIYDIISGTFFLCAAPLESEEFCGLNEEQQQTFLARFAVPEMFLMAADGLLVIPCP